MLKLNNFEVDDTRIITVDEKTIVVEFIPAIVEVLSYSPLTDDNINKISYYLFGHQLDNIPPIKKVRIIRDVLHISDQDNKDNIKDEYETTIDLTSLFTFLTSNTNIPKHELLTKFSLVELIRITDALKGDHELPFYKHQRVAGSINDLTSLF